MTGANGDHRSSGFTLLEVVVALTLLAAMLSMLVAGLRTANQAWDSGVRRGDQTNQMAVVASFLRRELSLAFPWRFKDPLAVRLAFEGKPDGVRFVSMRPAEVGGGGLAFVSVRFEPGEGGRPGRLLMRRMLVAASEADFAALESAEAFELIGGVELARLSYFGSESDLQPPSWADTWSYPTRLPSHVRIELRLPNDSMPDLVVALKIGEEAGCIEWGFQRTCVPRR